MLTAVLQRSPDKFVARGGTIVFVFHVVEDVVKGEVFIGARNEELGEFDILKLGKLRRKPESGF